MEPQEKPELELRAELEKIQAFRKAELKRGSITESLFAFFKQLRPEEQHVLKILFNAPHALSVRQIKKEYMFILAATHPDVSIKAPALQDIPKPGFRVNQYGASFRGDIENRLKTERDAEAFISFFNKNSPEKVPSYYKIKSTLEFFEKEGVCGRRSLAEQKAEEVWYLTPSFSKIYFLAITALEKREEANEATPLERKTYWTLTGRELITRLDPSAALRKAAR